MEPGMQKKLAARIRRARREMPGMNGRPLSQQMFADRLGVHVITVSQWERGTSSPNVENLAAISRETGNPLSYFMAEGDDDEEDERTLRMVISELAKRPGNNDLVAQLNELAWRQKARNEARAEERDRLLEASL